MPSVVSQNSRDEKLVPVINKISCCVEFVFIIFILETFNSKTLNKCLCINLTAKYSVNTLVGTNKQ